MKTIHERVKLLEERFPYWQELTIDGHFQNAVARFPNNEFVVREGGDAFSYRAAEEEVAKTANALTKAGICAGDHVGVQMRNSPAQMFLLLALARINAVSVVFNTGVGERELSYGLQKADVKCLVTDETVSTAVSATDVKRLLGGVFSVERGDETRTEIASIFFTSGSSGNPRAVALTHDMMMRAAYANCLNRGFEENRRVYVPLPMSHCYGFVEGLLSVILVGGTLLFSEGKFEPAHAVSFMKEYRANDILSVPGMMMKLTDYLKEHPTDLPDLYAVYCSAVTCPETLWSAIKERLGVEELITGYGMTEVCGASMQTTPADDVKIHATRVGRLLDAGVSGNPAYGGRQLEYKVVDPETLVMCEEGVSGELLCRGDTVIDAYYKEPEKNKQSFVEGGWLRTGDRGYFDEDGYLVFQGRLNDMYKINGENVSPTYIESVVDDCEEIKIVQIVGIADERHGAVGVAFIEPQKDTEKSREIIEDYFRDHLATYQIPKYFIYMKDEDWPYTPSGKINKTALKKRLEEKGADV